MRHTHPSSPRPPTQWSASRTTGMLGPGADEAFAPLTAPEIKPRVQLAHWVTGFRTQMQHHTARPVGRMLLRRWMSEKPASRSIESRGLPRHIVEEVVGDEALTVHVDPRKLIRMAVCASTDVEKRPSSMAFIWDGDWDLRREDLRVGTRYRFISDIDRHRDCLEKTARYQDLLACRAKHFRPPLAGNGKIVAAKRCAPRTVVSLYLPFKLRRTTHSKEKWLMMSLRTLPAAALLALGLLGNAHAQTETAPTSSTDFVPEVGQSGKDVIWVPTPQALVDRMLDMVALTPQDTLVDLGSGDGRTVITAAKRGARARGIEFNPDMVALSRSAALREGVADRATFEQADIFESDFSDATVVTLFLLPGLNLRLRPILLDMEPGTRVVSNSFTMGDWEPDETGKAAECENYCIAYKWTVPAKVEGKWKTADGELTLVQKYQFVEGTLRKGDTTVPITDGRLNGAEFQFKAGSDDYVARVSGKQLLGTVNGSTDWKAAL